MVLYVLTSQSVYNFAFVFNFTVRRYFKMGKVSTAYLVAYNALQCAGWTYVFYLFFPHLVHLLQNGTPSSNLYQDIALPLRFFQVAAYLEVLHNILGIVKSSPVITAVQVTSRVFLVCGICDNFQVIHKVLLNYG